MIAIVGSGIAGLSASIKAVELGSKVVLISPDYSERSQSVMAMGGINASLNTKGEDDSVNEHYKDTVKGGVYINNLKAVESLCEDAPGIVKWLSSIGTSFTRDKEGNIDLRYFGGQKNMRTAYAGARTGKQIVTALVNKLREYEINGSVKRYVGWRFLSLIISDGECLGLNIINENTGEVKQILSGSVIVASGGLNKLFGRTSGSVHNDGYVSAKLFTQGVELANLEMIQFHPTTIKTSSKRMLISEAARGEGGKLYVEKDGEKFYFMREWYPEFKELMPRDVVSKSIYKICKDLNLSEVYLDISKLDKELVERKLDEVCEVSRTYLGIDPCESPIPVYPGIHYFMGGINTNEKHETNIKGLYAAGECSSQYHGANRLGGNSLLGAVHGGLISAKEAVKCKKISSEKYEIKEKEYPIFNEDISEVLIKGMGIYRSEDEIKEGLENLKTIETSEWSILAEAILKSALSRKESRGAHQRLDYPETLEEYKKTTISKYENNKVKISFRKI